jgi:TM2 domain-containing membrane protein YozV
MRIAKSQTTAFALSLFIGFLGADRCYLGHYTVGVFKGLTVGGLGLIYILDVFLILFGWLGPADGALYPERLGIYD